MSLKAPTPGTMLGLAARENQREQRASRPRSSVRMRFSKAVRLLLAVGALAIGLSGFSMSSAQAWPWDDWSDNIAASIANICSPNDVPEPTHHASTIDTLAGLNQESRAGYRDTILPDFSQDEDGAAGGVGTERLQNVYEEHGPVIAEPTYERYGFAGLTWNQYGNECFTPGLMLSPVADMVLSIGVNVPMMIGMAFLNIVMDTTLYEAFATMMHPFISAMYRIFEPWIFFIVPIGIFVTWLASNGSLQATIKAAGWGFMILCMFLLMGASTSQFVTWATNIVTQVSGTVACQINAAGTGEGTGQETTLAPREGEDPPGPLDQGNSEECDSDDPIRAINQALWFGIPYQTWHVGQVGETQAEQDEDAYEQGEVGWGPALLNAQYIGTGTTEGTAELDPEAETVLRESERWNRANYTPESDTGKIALWGEGIWEDVPYLGTIKMMCNDVGEPGNEPADDPDENTRFMYSGSDQEATFCDAQTADTQTMMPYIQGQAYNHQFLLASSGVVGSVAVAVTILVAATYLGFQKMMFFFLLFLAPLVMIVSAIGDRKRRPFAVRYAEILAVNLLKQVAAVSVVLFVSHAMSSLFGSALFTSVPWIMKPYIAILFFLALAFLAFPLKNLVKGAAKGDTTVLDKQATAPQRALATGGKLAGKGLAIGGAVATAGIAAPAVAGAMGKGAMLGKAGTALGQAGRAVGGGKAGRAMRSTGMLLRNGQNVMDSKDTKRGQQAALNREAGMLMNANEGGKYRDEQGQLRPGAAKMARKDAAKMAEDGQKSNRATRAQDAHMKAFFSQYQADHNGKHHPDDPNSPENKRQARMQNHRNDARGEGAPTPRPGPTPDPNYSNQGPGGPGNNNAGGGYNGPGNNGKDSKGDNKSDEFASRGGDRGPWEKETPDGKPDPNWWARTRPLGEQLANPIVPDYAPARERYQSAARENLNGPAFAKDMDYDVNTVRSGADVLSKAGLSQEQAVENPTALLSGDAYEGGATTKMDPFHPATQSLNNLRFASASKDPDAMERAVSQASGDIAQHGVPDQVSGISSIGDKAGQFQSVQLVGAMPTLDENSTWQERSEAAHTMMAAQVAMPQDYAAREAVENYTSALANPAVPVQQVESIKASAIEQISQADGLESSAAEPQPAPVSGAFAGTAAAAAGAAAAGAGSGGGDGYAPTNYEAPMATPAAGESYDVTPSSQQAYSGSASGPAAAPHEPANYSEGTSQPPPAAYSSSGYSEGTPQQAPAGPPPAAYEPPAYTDPTPAPTDPAPAYSDPTPAPSYTEQAPAGPDRYSEGYSDGQMAQGYSSGGSSPEALRDAVSEGLRDHAQNHGGTPSGGQYAGAAFQAAPLDSAPLDSAPTDAAPMESAPPPSAPSGPRNAGMSAPAASTPEPDAGASEYPDQGDSDEGMIFRPPTKRKKSSFFDQDESSESDS